MKGHTKFRAWCLVGLIVSLLAPAFLMDTPSVLATTRSSNIRFWIFYDQITYLKVEGNNQYDRPATWSQSYPSAVSSAETSYGNTKWWWNGTLVLTFRSQNLGWRQCVIDNLNTVSNQADIIYTPGKGCSGDSGAGSSHRALYELYNHMSHSEANQIAEAADSAINKYECLMGIAGGLESPMVVMTIVACGGAALYTINPILERLGTHVETSSTSSPTGRWTVRIFNMDDAGRVYLNRDWNRPVAQAGYGQDTGWVDITSRMSGGDNLLTLANWNESSGYTWGFQLAYNGTIVWASQAGQAGVRGANNDDMSRRSQYSYVVWLTLRANGTVAEQ